MLRTTLLNGQALDEIRKLACHNVYQSVTDYENHASSMQVAFGVSGPIFSRASAYLWVIPYCAPLSVRQAS